MFETILESLLAAHSERKAACFLSALTQSVASTDIQRMGVLIQECYCPYCWADPSDESLRLYKLQTLLREICDTAMNEAVQLRHAMFAWFTNVFVRSKRPAVKEAALSFARGHYLVRRYGAQIVTSEQRLMYVIKAAIDIFDFSIPCTDIGTVVEKPSLEVLQFNKCTPVKIASHAYYKADFGQLPILADALEEGGYKDNRLLDHLRSDQEHWRGCWALDKVLDASVVK
jgi:hypothetical protein